MSTGKRSLAIVAALMLTVAALAGQAGSRNDGSRTVQLRETAVILGSSVRPGSYTLRWTREPGSENVLVELARGKEIVATGKGRWIETEKPWPYEALVYRTGNGPDELTEVRFRKSADVIRVESAAARAEARQETGADKD